MKTYKIICFIVVISLSSCSSLKKSMITTGINLQDVAIHNAILDFSTHCKLFEKDSIFSVGFSDSIFNKAILMRVDEKDYKDRRTHEWIRGTLYDGIVGVEISASNNQIYYSEEKKMKLPSKFVIKNGKLFYWYDNNHPVTDEMIAVLRKYNLLQEDLTKFFDQPHDDTLKGADYFFCKNDLSKYKRVVTNIGLGFYQPPRLNCNK